MAKEFMLFADRSALPTRSAPACLTSGASRTPQSDRPMQVRRQTVAQLLSSQNREPTL